MNPNLRSRETSGAKVKRTDRGFRLRIPAGSARDYRLAQLDDYAKTPRARFPAHPPFSLSLRARVSRKSIPGTWGFGLWNDPFGLSLGFGGDPLRLPALPNAVWFFHASEENHLSFRPDKPGQGFLVQAFSSPLFHPLLLPVGLHLLFSRRTARTLLSRIIQEDGTRLRADATQWHRYRIEWSSTRTTFRVDGKPVLATSISPQPPLGLVLWIDNQYAAFTPEGKVRFGLLENTEPDWLEIEALEMG